MSRRLRADGHPPEGHEAPKGPGRSIVATYDYTDANGKLAYQVVRFHPKGFSQRRREVTPGGTRWVWNLKGVTRYLFRLPLVRAAAAQKRSVYIVEGEKDVLTLEKMGLTATCNAGGAGKWLKSYSQQLAGADAVILPDNDLPGKGHAELVAQSLNGLAARIRVVELPDLPPKGDVSDWVRAGGIVADLQELVGAAPDWKPRKGPDAPIGVDGQYLHDIGNARRLVQAHGGSVHYCCDRGRWYFWDGRHWAEDQTGEVVRMAKGIVDTMLERAGEAREKAQTDGDKAALVAVKEFEKHAVTSGNHGRVVAMLLQAQSEPGVPVLYSDMDGDPWLFNCVNGTVDLYSGVRASIRQEIVLWLEPKTAITDDIRRLVQENKAAIIEELLQADAPSPASQSQPAEHVFPEDGEWSFTLRVTPEAVVSVDAVRDKAMELGWTEAGLYQNRGRHPFPYGQDYGLVCFLSGNRQVGGVAREHIEIVFPHLPGKPNRLYNPNVPQPWAVRKDFEKPIRQSTTLSEKRR